MSYVDSAKLQEYTTKLGNKLKTLFSSPLQAATAADMTDTEKVYVYTGSETGYTAGNWYFYDGSDWVSGGVYNAAAVNTDATLTAPGVAADARAAGNAVRDLYHDGHDASLWTIGSLRSADGTNFTSAARIRTELLAGTIRRIKPAAGYKIAVYVYNASGVYQGMWDGAELITSPMTWFTDTVDLWDLPSGSQVRVIAGDTNDSTITAATRAVVAANIIFSYRTDPDLALSGAAADAAAVGSFKEDKGVDFLKKYAAFQTATSNGITFAWDWPKCVVSGTRKSSQAIYTVYDNRTSLPLGMRPGDRFLLRYYDTNQSVNLQWYVFFWNAAGNTWRFETRTWSGTGYNLHYYLNQPLTVPEGCVGMTVQLRVPSGSTAFNATINYLELIKLRKIDMPTKLIVSFIDDDTSGYEYVRKYREACRHNGVFGNFAVLTRYLEDSYTGSDWTGADMRERLLGYEDEGFGMLLHAYRQSSSDPWQSLVDEDDVAQCRAMLLRGLRDMRNYGFVDYNYWVTPYGLRGSKIRRMAREAGLECMISTNNGRHNSMQDYEKDFIKRVALNSDDTRPSGIANAMQDVKDAIDAAAADGAGWLIITTHFNEWGSLTWDSTLDGNGFEVGYSRFNEMAQYALDAGMTPMTFSRAWSYYKPILEANSDIVSAIMARE